MEKLRKPSAMQSTQNFKVFIGNSVIFNK